jgi:two-component system, OmpR family, phosphate regulon response regulator PhoB
MARLLIVEDEPDAADLLALHAKRAGHDVTIVEDGAKALTVARTIRPELILLDHMLPGMTGTEITKALRADASTKDIPIVLLTARAAEEDRVRGFECGADDYVTKPYSVKELMLRVARHLERSRQAPSVVDQQLSVGPFHLDLGAQVLTVAGMPIHLTSIEFKFMVTLMRAPGTLIARTQLLTEVWGYAEDTDTRTVDSHVRRLRVKLGDYAGAVQTVPGAGFRLDVGE